MAAETSCEAISRADVAGRRERRLGAGAAVCRRRRSRLHPAGHRPSADGLSARACTCWAIRRKRSTSRRKSSCACSGRCRSSAASPRSAPGSIASSSIRRRTGSAGGGGGTAVAAGRARRPRGDARRAAGVAELRDARPGAAAARDRRAASGRRSTRCRSISAPSIVLREIDGLSYDEIATSLERRGRHGQVASGARRRAKPCGLALGGQK